jgi:hypothetical protein
MEYVSMCVQMCSIQMNSLPRAEHDVKCSSRCLRKPPKRTFAHVHTQAIYLQLTTKRTGKWKTSVDQLQMRPAHRLGCPERPSLVPAALTLRQQRKLDSSIDLVKASVHAFLIFRT